MEMREMTCIACPMGCRMMVGLDDAGEIKVEGYGCKRGITYGTQEFTCPMRQVTSTVLVEGGARPVCSVKTSSTIPKAKIDEALCAISKARPKAPVRIGDVIIRDIAGCNVDLVATSACAGK